MKKADVLKFFGGWEKTAEMLGVTRQAVHQWPDVIPDNRQLWLEHYTNGKLLMEPRLLAPGFKDRHAERRAKMYGGGK